MYFGRVARSFLEGFRDWDGRSKSAFILAGVLLVMVLTVGGRLPDEYRTSVIIGIIGLLVTMQAIFLYANRGMVTNVTKAQRLILAGRYAEAATLLETTVVEKPDAQALALLGNAYRMLGRVAESLEILTKAVQMSPKHHFYLYSFGRTLMASGQYADAAVQFRHALEQGAPPFARVDAAEAAYRAGQQVEPVHEHFDEPHITLMAQYVAWRVGQGNPPDAALIAAGLPYWDKTAVRFAATPYGRDVEQDIAVMHGLAHDT